MRKDTEYYRELEELEDYEERQEYNRRRRGIIIKLVAVVACIAIAFGIYETYQRLQYNAYALSSKLNQIANKYDTQSKELESQKALISSELENVQSKMSSAGANLATVVMLFAEPDVRIMNYGLATTISAYKLTSLIAVSEEYFPGEDGCLSVYDMLRLTDTGWSIALTAYDTSTLDHLADRLEDAGLPKATAVYFPNGVVTKEDKNAVIALGIDTIITYRPETVTDSDDVIFEIPALGSYESGVKAEMTEMIEASEAVVTVTGFINSREEYRDSNFTSMVKYIAEEVSAGVAACGDIDLAKARRTKMLDQKEAAEHEFGDRLVQLTAELERINDEISELTKKRYEEIKAARGE